MSALANFLTELGVKTIYFGAGARNSPLIQEFKSFVQTFGFDERSLAFQALGEAKLSQRPTVVCTTSGTAVAQCFAAMIEAYYSKIPLIMISADRPARLRNTGAPQAINQIDIFAPYIKTHYSGDLANFQLNSYEYPLHLNVEIDNTNLGGEGACEKLTEKEFCEGFQKCKKPLGIITEGEVDEKALRLLDELNVPVYIECTSDLKKYPTENRIWSEKTILKKYQENEWDLILKFGGTPITKLWRLLDQKTSMNKVVGVGVQPLGLPGGYSIDKLPKNLIPKEKRTLAEVNLDLLLEDFPDCELSIIKKIYQALTPDDLVFVGNSMPIRYWQMIDRSQNTIFASRGANGIDGQISTAIGMARSSEKRLHCLVGDITFLYDLNCLWEDLPSNLMIHVINNGGGRIFERVNTAKQMLLSHQRSVNQILPHQNVKEYFPNREQTQAFWKAWET